MFEDYVDVIGRLDGLNILGVDLAFVLLKEVVVGNEGGLFDMFFVDDKDGEGLFVGGGGREEVNVVATGDGLPHDVVFNLLA